MPRFRIRLRLADLCKQSGFRDISFRSRIGIGAASVLLAGDELGSNTGDIFPRVRTEANLAMIILGK